MPASLDVIDPATEEASGDDLDRQRRRMSTRPWPRPRRRSQLLADHRAERIDLLQRILAEYKKRFGDIANAITEEMGAPASLAQRAQAATGIAHLDRMIAGAAKTSSSRKTRHHPLIVKEPIGVCGMITPWNWPINQIACKVAPALATGCTMVLKPSEIAPFTAIIWAEIMHAAGVPAGRVQHGQRRRARRSARRSPAIPDIDMVSFTGSTRAGIVVAKAAADTVKRVAQELGGKSPQHHPARRRFRDARSAAGVAGDSATPASPATRRPGCWSRPNGMDEAVAIAKAAAETFTVGDPTAEGTDWARWSARCSATRSSA